MVENGTDHKYIKVNDIQGCEDQGCDRGGQLGWVNSDPSLQMRDNVYKHKGLGAQHSVNV